MRLLEDAGIETTGQRGYHILARLAREALICIGPMQGKQQTFVLLDDWAPRSAARELTRAETLADLAGRFVASRGPVTDHDFARWAGITLGDARRGLEAAPALASRELDGAEYWVAADQAGRRAAAPAGARSCSRGLTSSSWATRIAWPSSRHDHAAKVVPGANGIFKPMVVVGGEIVGTWTRTLRPRALTIELRPFEPGVAELAERVRPDAERYRAFLGLPASTPVTITGEPA